MNLQTKERARLTVRVKEDDEIIIRSSYELFRQKALLEGKKVPSLNDYLAQMLSFGILVTRWNEENQEDQLMEGTM
tara:strand:- start:92 stop:319 length:228 start_codon:yes stop_codon:yes gene_type:complete